MKVACRVLIVLVVISLVIVFFRKTADDEAKQEEWTQLYEQLAKPFPISKARPDHASARRNNLENKLPRTLPEYPNDLQINQAGLVGSTVFPIDGDGTKPADWKEQNKALVALLKSLGLLDERESQKALKNWLTDNQESRWWPALQDVYLGGQYQRGYFRESRDGWDKLWNDLKGRPNREALLLGNKVMKQLLDSHCGFTNSKRLRELVTGMTGRYRDGVLEGKVMRARQSLWLREHTGAANVMCGPLALNAIGGHLKKQFVAPNLNQVKTDYIGSGIPLHEIRDYAVSRYGFDAQLAKQSDDSATIPTPSVVHFRDEHFAAVLEYDAKESRYLLEDRAHEFKGWVDANALSTEMSGRILLAANTSLPSGWDAMSEAEARTVFGKDGAHGIENPEENITENNLTTNQNPENPEGELEEEESAFEPDEPDGCEGIEGMPRYTFYPFPGSLRIRDIPLRYRPPVGPKVAFKINYVDLSGSASDADVSPVGAGWACDWVSYVVLAGRTNAPSAPRTLGDATVHVPGGGIRRYELDSATGLFKTSDRNFSTAEVTFGGSGMGTNDYEKFTISFPNGWKHVYGHYVQRTTPLYRFFLSEVIDPAGNSLHLTYEDELVVAPDAGGSVIPRKGSTRLTSVTDALGQVTTIEYGPVDTILWNRITKVTDPFGRSCQMAYDNLGRLISVTDMINLQSSFSYTTEGFPASMVTPYGTTTFSKTGESLAGGGGSVIDATSDRIIEATDPMERTERIQFIDKTGGPAVASLVAPLSSVNVAGSTVPFYAENARLNFRNSFYWDKEQYHACELATPEGEEIDFDVTKAVNYRWYTDENYQVTGVLEAVKQPLRSRTWFNYPGAGIINAGGHSYFPGNGRRAEKTMRMLDASTAQLTQTYYNHLGKLTRRIDPVGRSTLFTYALNGIDLTAVTQTSQGVSERLATITYNTQHQPLTVKDAAGQTTTIAYNAKGQVASVQNAKSEVTTFGYDSSHYLTSVDGALAGNQDTTTFDYNPLGNIRKVTASDGYAVVIDYDDFDRATQYSYPDGTFRKMAYNRLDLASVTDRIGRVTNYTYHADRRVASVTDPGGRVLQYLWCRCGDLKELTDAMGYKTTWDRDVQGRVTRKQYADGSRTDYFFHDKSGRLEKRTDAKGQEKLYSFTTDGRLSQVSYPNALVATPTVSWTYDLKYPRRATMTDGEGNTTYAYHPITSGVSLGAGNLSAIDGPWTNDTISFTYDELGRNKSRTTSGSPESFTFDPAGRITDVDNALGHFDYSYVGTTRRLLQVLNPNGQKTNFDYTAERRLSLIEHRLPNNAVLSSHAYEHDALGRINRWTQASQNNPTLDHRFSYDASGQLTRSLLANGGLASSDSVWTYDANGNRLSESKNGVQAATTYNNLNQMLESSAPSVPVIYEWDAENRMKSMTTGDERVEFSYNGRGMKSRIVTSRGGAVESTRLLSWGGVKPNALRDASGAITERYFGQGIEKIGGSTPGSFYFTRDHLGSVRDVTDAGGALRHQSSYGIWGARNESTSTFQQPIGFTGHYMISDLVSAPFRDYDSQSSRWLSRDPIGIQGGTNLYAYANNSPSNYYDPLGLDTWWANRGIGADFATQDSLSHTFIYTTDEAGNLMDTYSFGNEFYPFPNTTWFKNRPEDRNAAYQHIGNDTGTWVGPDSLDQYIQDEVSDRANDPNMDDNWYPWNNCKTRAESALQNAAQNWGAAYGGW